jgi:hypothetical protein
MPSVSQVLVISPEKEHHVKITAAMNRCGLLSICCAKFVEARIFMDKKGSRWFSATNLFQMAISGQ